MKKTLLSFSICVLLFTSFANAANVPDSHAPIGVMGDHNHKQGEWMLSYRYSTMHMEGNRDGTSSVSTENILSDFMVAPLEMTMQMHMFGLMYGVTDKLTLMTMLPYTDLSMDHVTRMGTEFTVNSEGIGDIKLVGIFTLYERLGHKFLFNGGLSFPTGSINKRANTPAGQNQKLPYPMQLGSGTYDLLPSITYIGKKNKYSWGSQLNAVIRLRRNDNEYRLGDKYSLNIWGAYSVNKFASLSIRFNGQIWDNIDGADSDLNPMMIPTARSDLRGGERIDALLGVNFTVPDGKLAGNRLAIEFGIPVYQNLDGPQLETDYNLILGWQFAF